ncbi:sigma-54 interaction domain-containing protein [Bacilliculturomica massiliensis]|uniref:sigma-54 interaction domain-containing protein n=1 Tax=Bacilliculturomica massiliensis TaxID=1917867 RepID=UPI001A917BA1|nr:sigma 54-interacting transcriptional regulator [Bacilliculturomica massiliensis]
MEQLKKRIVLFVTERDALKRYTEQMQAFFEDRVSIYPYAVPEIEDYDFPGVPKADLYVASMPDVIPVGMSKLDENVPAVYISRTFQREKTIPLTQLPVGAVVLFADYSEVIASETLGILNSISKGVNYIYCATEEEMERHGDACCVVTIRDDHPDSRQIKRVVNIGWYKIAPTTYMEIAKRLDILDPEISGKIYRYSKEVHLLNPGVFEVIKGTWELEDIWNTVSDMIDEGIVLVDTSGVLLRHNVFAEKQGAVTRGEDGIGFVCPEVREAAMGRYAMTDEVIELAATGKTVLVSKRPVLTYGELKGFLLLLKDAKVVQLAETRLRLQERKKNFPARYTFDDIVTCSPLMEKNIEICKKFARTDISILITGDSGTGKELFAQSVHNGSPRRSMPFVALNCAAVPAELLESELFGYADGAFTGAKKGGKRGLLELAHRGTIFFDEIGEMPLSVQAKILRVLQEREVMRIGGESLIPIDIRVIAASNVDFEELLEEKKFRKDLFYRLNAAQIHIPPLAERTEDIPLLAEHFLKEMGGKRLSKELTGYLSSIPWRGNARELRNCIEYMHIMGGSVLEIFDLPLERQEYADGHRSEGPGRGPQHRAEELTVFVDREQEAAEIILNVLRVRSVGRRMLTKILQENGVRISEYRVRKLLSLMEKQGLILMGSGRKGIELKK